MEQTQFPVFAFQVAHHKLIQSFTFALQDIKISSILFDNIFWEISQCTLLAAKNLYLYLTTSHDQMLMSMLSLTSMGIGI